MSGDQTYMTEFADLARALGAAGEEGDRLMLAVDAAVELIPGCLHAGITVNRDGTCHTLASTGEVLGLVNDLQNELGEGPCHAPDREEEVVIITDLVVDKRWSAWGGRVHGDFELGSVISMLVFTARGSYGTLSLYGAGSNAFDEDDIATALALAGHLAVALAAGREIEGMGAALQSRTVIGQAEGILMERLGVDVDQALAYLKRVSSHTNTKLVQVAAEIVRDRDCCQRPDCPRLVLAPRASTRQVVSPTTYSSARFTAVQTWLGTDAHAGAAGRVEAGDGRVVLGQRGDPGVRVVEQPAVTRWPTPAGRRRAPCCRRRGPPGPGSG